VPEPSPPETSETASRGKSDAARQSHLINQLSDTALLKKTVADIHYKTLTRGMFNPHLRLDANASLPAILSGDLCDARYVRALDEACSSHPATRPSGMKDDEWERTKRMNGKEIARLRAELTAMFDNMATAPEVIDKSLGITKQIASAVIQEKAAREIRGNWLADIDSYLGRICDIATRFGSYHDCQERTNLLSQFIDAIACAVKVRALVTMFDPAPEEKQYRNIVKKMTKSLTAPGKDGAVANADMVARLAGLLKTRMEEMLPSALGEEWARFKAGYEFSLLPGTPAKKSRVSYPENDHNILVEAYSILTCITGGVEYERYDPSSVGAPDVGMAELLSSGEQQKALSTAEKDRQTDVKVSVDAALLPRFFDEFSSVANVLRRQLNAMSAVFAVATTKGAAAVREEGKLADLKQAAGKLAETAEAFESLKLFLVAVTDSAAGVSGETKEQVASIVKELDYCEFAAHAASVIGKQYVEYLSESDTAASGSIARTAVASLVAEGEKRTGKKKRAKKKAKPPAEQAVLELPPQIPVAPVKPITREQRDMVASLHANAKETRALAKQAYNQHRIALTDLTEGDKLTQAIAIVDDATAAFQEALDIMNETACHDTGKVNLQEVKTNLANCRALGQLYRRYQESDLSKVPTEDTLKSMDLQGQFEVAKPVDRSFFQQLDGQNGNMFEVEVRFKDFEHEGESIEVKPVYLHIHVKKGVDASRMADLKDSDIVAAHLKSERQRLYGKGYEARTSRTVRRNTVSMPFAIEIARRASGTT
jgi:hypothetical protein